MYKTFYIRAFFRHESQHVIGTQHAMGGLVMMEHIGPFNPVCFFLILSQYILYFSLQFWRNAFIRIEEKNPFGPSLFDGKASLLRPITIHSVMYDASPHRFGDFYRFIRAAVIDKKHLVGKLCGCDAVFHMLFFIFSQNNDR